MKIYEDDFTPSCRRVRIFLAEKGIELTGQKIDVLAGENLQPDYLAKNPRGLLPLLELDDGRTLGESIAICRYFEEMHPDPPLMGGDPLDKAYIEMWSRWADFDGMVPVDEYVRNSFPGFETRGVHGQGNVPQVPELVDRSAARVKRFYHDLETQTQGHPYVTGEQFTVADIVAMCTVDFARFGGLDIPEDCPNVRTWFDSVGARPSAQAWPGMQKVFASRQGD